MPVTPINPQIWQAYLHSFREALSYVGRQVATRSYLPRHSRWLSLSWNDNGFPSFREDLFDGPYDYGNLLGPSIFIGVPETDEPPDLSELKDAVRADLALFDYFGGDMFCDTNSSLLIRYSIDRFVHLSNKFEASDEEAYEIYEPLERWFSLTSLALEIAVPILAVQFIENSYSIAEGIDLIKLSDAQQLARAPDPSFSYGHHPLVQAAATHAFKLANYHIENPSAFSGRDLHSPEVGGIVDLLFACLRLTAHLETGYAQVLALPIGWARSYEVDRIRILSESVKVYPSQLERGCWNMENPRVLTSEDVSQCSTLYGLLRTICSTDKRMEVAIRRFNNSYLRQNEEDSILDLLIALECLLSDGATGEMTHKLSLRVAALSSLSSSNKLSAAVVFREVKKIYDFRSAIVHGNVEKARKASSIERDGHPVSTVQAATEYLRTVIITLANNQDYLDPKQIDVLLLKSC
jgi:Apea-like HEPN